MRDLTKAQSRLYENAMAIQQETARDAKAIKFMARSMVLATLPHSDPGQIPAWGRHNGGYSLVIQPGYELDSAGVPTSLGIPYGTVPRLILCWLTSEAVQKKQREIELGSSLSDFMRKLDIIPTGGSFGSIPRVKKQMVRLFSSQISCTYNTEAEFARTSFALADKTYIWWDAAKNPEQVSLWKSAILLSQDFFDEITRSPVPIDMRALKALKGSSLQLDIYTWLTYRLSFLGKPIVIPWNQLQAQFGADYAETKVFAYKFKAALKHVLTVYKHANVTPMSKGLLMKPSRTSVSVNVIL